MTLGKKQDIHLEKAKLELVKRANVGLPPQVAKRIDRFLKSPAARKLGMKSRTDFCVKLTVAFLIKYDLEYEALSRLFELETEKVKGATEGDLD